MTPVPDDVREGYAEIMAQLRAVAEVVADVRERTPELEARMRDAFDGDDVPWEAWREVGAFHVARFAELIRMRLEPADVGLVLEPAEVAAEYGLPDDYATLMDERIRDDDEAVERRQRKIEQLERLKELERLVFELLTDGLDGEV